MTTSYHIPVLLHPSVEALALKPGGIYVDATFGGGGHTREILRQLEGGKLIAFDRDEDAEKNLPDDKRIIFVRNNFRFLRNFLRFHNIAEVDGILADLGVSSHHFDEGERGFSYRFTDADLDMRMNRTGSLTAQKIINTYSQAELFRVFSVYGEIDNPGKLVAILLKVREEQPIVSVQALIEAIAPHTPRYDEWQYLAKVFQALRIEVNQEMEALGHFLQQSTKALKPGGRLVVISYHSLEDRLVKNFIKTGNTEGKIEKDFFGKIITPFNVITRKAIAPSAEEIEQNNRARSAKLRVAEKI